ncbi:MAG TPA: hypothetical protein VJ719_10275 [Chthoniobacterales bacterium]|nr:hypothetical protein [Chthoniobacterales bacterium]
MDPHSHRAERVFIKLLLGGLIGFILLLVVTIGGYRFYQKWQADRLVKRAETYLSWGDSRSAALAGRRAFQLDASNAGACRVLAQTAERDNQAAAIEWRQQVINLAPDSMPDQIALARTALQFNRIDVAEAALAKLAPAAEQVAGYHEVKGQLAVARKDPVTAERHFAEAVRLEPDRKHNQLNLAVFQLQSSSRETRDRASALLQEFMKDQTLRVPAARAMRDYAAQRKDGPALLEITELLYGYPEATFRDRISYLQVLQALGHPQFATKVSELQDEAIKDPAKLITLLSWMNSNHLAVLAIDWSKQWPPEVAKDKVVRIAVADSYVTTNDPDRLQEWCKKADWGNLDFLRHAYLAWSARARGDDLGFQSEWNAAVHGAGSNGENLFSLQQNAAKWKWKEQAENLLWALTKDTEKQGVALTTLTQFYNEKGDTTQLYRVAARICEVFPQDDAARNNLANLSLLLNLNPDTAESMAEQLHRKAPANPVYASTYAFALYRKGRPQQAVEVMNKLKPADLEQPAMAAYYGVFLAAAGDKTKAAEYLQRGESGRLLPEEKALVEQAKNR